MGLITRNEIFKLRYDLDDISYADAVATRALLAFAVHLHALCRESLELIDATWETATPLSARLRQAVEDGEMLTVPIEDVTKGAT